MMRGLWRNFVPFLLWWPDVDRAALKADALAALTGAVVVLPQGVAFATIAGMPPEYGLYAAMVPAIVAALFGSSRQLVSGPTTAASIGPVLEPERAGGAGQRSLRAVRAHPHLHGGRHSARDGPRAAGDPRQLRLALGHRGVHLRGRGADRGEPAQELPRPTDAGRSALPRDPDSPLAALRRRRPRLGRGGARHPRGGDRVQALVAAVSVHDRGTAGRKPARRDHRVLHLCGVPAPCLGRVRPAAGGRRPGDAAPALGPGVQPPRLHRARPDCAGGDPVRP